MDSHDPRCRGLTRSDRGILDSDGGPRLSLSLATMARRTTAAAEPASVLERDACALQSAVADLSASTSSATAIASAATTSRSPSAMPSKPWSSTGRLRLGALAERLFLDKSTTSRVVGSLVKKGTSRQQAEATDVSEPLHSTPRPRGRRLSARITIDLVEPQKQLLQDRTRKFADAVVGAVRGLAAIAADSRFRSGVSVFGGLSTRRRRRRHGVSLRLWFSTSMSDATIRPATPDDATGRCAH